MLNIYLHATVGLVAAAGFTLGAHFYEPHTLQENLLIFSISAAAFTAFSILGSLTLAFFKILKEGARLQFQQDLHFFRNDPAGFFHYLHLRNNFRNPIL